MQFFSTFFLLDKSQGSAGFLCHSELRW